MVFNIPQLWNSFLGHNMMFEFTEYVTADEKLETSEPLTDDSIISMVQEYVNDPHTESNDELIPLIENPPSHMLASEMCHKIRLYMESQLHSTKEFASLNLIEQFMRKENRSVCKNPLSISLLSAIFNKQLKA